MGQLGTVFWRTYFGIVVVLNVLFFSIVGLSIITVTRSPDRGHKWCAPRFGRGVLAALRIPFEVRGADKFDSSQNHVFMVTHASDYHLFVACALTPMQWRAVVAGGVKRIPLAGRVEAVGRVPDLSGDVL